MNAHAERFNRTIQESFVDYHEELLFTDLALFNRKLADWLVFYNTERPHHSLGQQSPLSFLLKDQPECQRYWTHTKDRSMAKSILAIACGAALGALLRWFLGLKLNSFFPAIPPGTLAANLIGGYIIGLAIAYFAWAPSVAPEWRLMIITGFCGGLTTFSTFSAEVVTLLQQGRLLMALGAVGVHVGGSLLATFAGIVTWQLLRRGI